MPEDDDGLCPAGRATLQAHADRMGSHDERLAHLEAKLDRIILLLVTTLATAVLNLAYILLRP